MRSRLRHLSLAVLGILGACDMFGGSSDQGNAVAGGSSDQGNALAVQVLDSTGHPWVGARVLVRPANWTADSLRVCDSLCGFAGETDAMGMVRGLLASGRYVVTTTADSSGSYSEVVVDSSRRDAIVLRPEARLRMEGVAPRLGAARLYVPGTERTIELDAQGRFRTDLLPPGVRRLTTPDGRTIRLDSLDPGTISFFSSLPMPGATASARPDSSLYLPPVLVIDSGDGVSTPWHVRIRPRVPGTVVEWARDSGNSWTAWSETRTGFYVDSTRDFWFRTRRPGIREGLHDRVGYRGHVAPVFALLPLQDSLPSYRLQAWKPDSVWASGDTVWILSIANSCHSLPWHGVAAQRFEDTLRIWRRECPDGLGGRVRILLNVPSRRGIWTVTTLQPAGYTWEIP